MSALDYSIGEIGALVLKAYRGSGMPWGLAEEAGFAASWLAMHRLPGIEAFAGLLTGFDGVPVQDRMPTGFDSPMHSSAGLLCPVAAGVALLDYYRGADWHALALGATAYPIILVPFIDALAKSCQQRVMVRWATLSIVTGGDGVVIDGDPSLLGIDRSDQILLSCDDQAAAPRKGVSRRGQAHHAALQVLESLAHRTYVPASEASRLSGAGAGLIDTD